MVRFRPQRELPHLSENKPMLLHLSRQQGCPGACDGRGSEPAQRRPFLPCPTTLAAGTSIISTPNFPESHCRSFPLLPLLLRLSQRHLWLVVPLHPGPWQPEQATRRSKPTRAAGVTCPWPNARPRQPRRLPQQCAQTSRRAPASGPSRRPFLPPGRLFPQRPAWPASLAASTCFLTRGGHVDSREPRCPGSRPFSATCRPPATANVVSLLRASLFLSVKRGE